MRRKAKSLQRKAGQASDKLGTKLASVSCSLLKGEPNRQAVTTASTHHAAPRPPGARMDTQPVVTITTPQEEVITYRRNENGYWYATQVGMPDMWGLSRVASRAVDEMSALTARLTVVEAALEYVATIYERPASSELARLNLVVNHARAALGAERA